MARVKHKTIKHLVYDEVSNIDDRTFFTSKEFCSYLQDILDIISCAYQTRKVVRVSTAWNDEKNASVAWTNSEKLFINAGTYLMEDVASRADRFEGVLGLLLHETGHLLFTDFGKVTEISNGIRQNRLCMIPNTSMEDEYAAYENVRDYILGIKNTQILNIINMLWNSISNALEDGHIDMRVGKRYPGYKPYLDFINDLCYEKLPSVSEIKAERNKKMQENPEEPVFLISDFLKYLLFYSRYGYIKGEDWEIKKEEAALKVYDLIDWIDFAKEEDNSEKRLLYQSIVFYKAFPYDYVDAMINKYGNEESSQVDEESKSCLNDVLDSLVSPKGLSNAEGTALSDIIKKTKDYSSTSEKDQVDSPESNIPEADSDEDEIASSNDSLENSDEQNVATASTSEANEVTSEDKELDYDKLASAMLNMGSENSREKSQKKGLESAEHDMQRVLDKIVKNQSLKARENGFKNELNLFAASIKHREIHNGITCRIERIEEADENLKESYERIWEQIKDISFRLSGRLNKKLGKLQKGYKQKNLYFGKRLESSALIRRDGKYFSKKTLPSSKKRMAVGLLVDESGSMSGADRITHARLTSLILYDFCNRLNIPIAVYGHSTGYDTDVLLNAYADFDSVDKNDRYRIMKMDCIGGNRDGYALRFLAERLMLQSAEIKLLFIISDGRPAARGYSGNEAFEDLASIKKEYRRKGIITIAAAIGNDKETIEMIYGKEAFLDVMELKELPENLIAIIKSYL